jgi:hypothetical protein
MISALGLKFISKDLYFRIDASGEDQPCNASSVKLTPITAADWTTSTFDVLSGERSAARVGPTGKLNLVRSHAVGNPVDVRRVPADLRHFIERAVVVGPGCRGVCGVDRRLYPPQERVSRAVSGDQLPRLQRLLEQSAAAIRPQGFPMVSRSMPVHHAGSNAHGGDHRRAGDASDVENSRFRLEAGRR